ncbi:MAG: EthD domain-containing protein [Deltaproteobacteria bacterium]|nr:EthD domain-containing protein [Deltaproteobacteria bacterium]MBW2386070.1 EthD domain-containing protein [Deltaproteobacteria bacterium]MBW2697294.1 EthD domain-containing protein [Deltaproteobacteria bacterium]
MEKLVYLIHQDAAAPGSDLRRALIDKATPTLREAGASQIAVNVHDEHVSQGAGVTISRSEPPIRAMVSFWLQNVDDRAPCEAALAQHSAALHGYLTVESRPVVHSPPLGERAPGANLVTPINKKADISYEQFIGLWTHEHKRVACETQSTFAYVRNAVVRPLTAAAPQRDGIVEESFPIEALSDPHVWYDCDDDDEYKRRLKRMMDSVNAFLDLGVLESIPMSEYWLG